MKRYFVITGAMLLFFGMLFVAAGAWADMTSVPVKGKWSGIDYTVSQCPNGEDMIVNIGKGVSNVGGETDLLSVVCTSCSQPIPDYPFCVELESSGWMVATAANGDALHLQTHGFVDLTDGSWTEEEVVVGGTGRFKDAEGVLETNGNSVFPANGDLFPYDADPPILPGLLREPGFYVATTDGWITY